MTVDADPRPDFDTASAAAFRRDLRSWLATAVPVGLRDVYDWTARPVRHTVTDQARLAALGTDEFKAWEQVLLHAGLICPQWPETFGGRELPAHLVMVVNEEFNRAAVPRIVRDMGENLVGPALLRHGTPEQQSHFLPRIVRGDDVYCQGYSEPGSGSDLASLTTRGTLDGDELVIRGRKIWTSHAHHATMMFVLCRTGDPAQRHRTITYALLDLIPGNGVEIRPITEMSGIGGFSECVLDDARVPLFNVIGGVNGGWAPAMTSLSFERSGEATTAYLAFAHELTELIRFATGPATATPSVRSDLAWAWIEVQTMRAMGLRSAANLIYDREPGPEALMHKLFWSEYHRRFGEIALRASGADAIIGSNDCPPAIRKWQDVFMLGRSETIFAGTSEIQRNTIAERGLGLPR